MELLSQLAQRILTIQIDHPLRVGIDGVDGAGKTFLADELSQVLPSVEVVRASIDSFHNPRAVRYQRGRESAEGYYRDSFNLDLATRFLLQPLGPDGSLEYRTAAFDHRTDAAVDSPLRQAPKNAVLLMDGVFLFRPELVNYWDLKIFLDADFGSTVPRAVQRDVVNSGGKSVEEITARYQMRYVEGQKLYFREAHPKEVADIVIDNTDFENPRIVRQ